MGVTDIDSDSVMTDVIVIEQDIRAADEVRTALVVVVVVKGAMVHCDSGCVVEITTKAVGMEKRVVDGAVDGGIQS